MRHLPKASKHSRFLFLAGVLGLAACTQATPPEPLDKPTLGLMTSLPILWSGNDAFATLAEGQGAPHWAKTAIEANYVLDPVDALSEQSLAGKDILLLAQPRVLSPQENVALDTWVRSGGKVLLFADPKLVGDYDAPLGDPRRPMDTVLLSPILARWGLELLQGEDTVETFGLGEAEMAIAAAGSLRQMPADGSTCAVAHQGVLASCTIGKGRVVVLADATLLEDPVGGPGSPDALQALLGMARENLGPESGMAGE